MRRISSNSESGAILAIVIILMLALTITGIAFLNAGVMEYRLAKREDYKNKAFYIAEGGLERTIWNLKEDFENGGDWTGWNPEDGINDVPVVAVDGDNILFYDGVSSVDLGEGSYEVKLDFIDGDELLVISTGTVKDIPRTVRIRVKAVLASPWNNAIFARKSAAGGAIIEGAARIHGSVLILGEGDATEPVMDMSGDAGVRNNYDIGAAHGMPFDLSLKVPSIVNDDGIETLDAVLRVAKGQVGLSGSAIVGEEPPNDPIKRTMDAVYVPDGFVGDGIDNVYSDNNPLSAYDLNVTFPSLLDPHHETGGMFLEYLRDNSLHITIKPGEPPSEPPYPPYVPGDESHHIPESKISSEFPFQSIPFNLNDKGAISWSFNPDKGLHGVVELEIEGIVWIEAESLSIGNKLVPIEYSGRGVIVVADYVDEVTKDAITRNIEVHGDLLAEGIYRDDLPIGYPGGQSNPDQGGFPHHALGLVTGTLGIAHPGEAGLMLTGAFFAENTIYSGWQNEIAGAFVSNSFHMGDHVPRIYQVPELATNVPEGMPGGPPNWVLITSEWKELPNY